MALHATFEQRTAPLDGSTCRFSAAAAAAVPRRAASWPSARETRAVWRCAAAAAASSRARRPSWRLTTHKG